MRTARLFRAFYQNITLASAVASLLLPVSARAQEGPAVHLVKDINPGAAGSDPELFVTLDGAAYFRANDGAHGFEL